MTSLGSRTKLMTRMITEILRLEALVVVEEVTRDSVLVEVDSKEVEVVWNQLEAVVIPVASKIKNTPSSNLLTRHPSKTEIFSAMTPNLIEAEGTKEAKQAIPWSRLIVVMTRSLRNPDKTYALTLSSTMSLRDRKILKSLAVVPEAEDSTMEVIRT